MRGSPARNADSKEILEQSLVGARWNYVGIIGRVAMQLLTQIVLARLLDPQAFGAVALGTMIIWFAILLAEMGMSIALIQGRHIGERDIRAAFTIVVGLSVLFAISIYVGRFTFARIFDEPVLADVLPPLLILLAAKAVSAIATSLLLRDMNFKCTQISMLVSYFVGFVLVGVGTALMGAGVWALVAAWVTQYALDALILYSFTRFPMLPTFRFNDWRIARFGGFVTLSNLVNCFIEYSTNFVLGRAFGSATLGNYSLAATLARSPTDHLVTSVQGVLFSSVAAMQHNREAIKRGYLLVIATLALVACPVFVGLAVTADTVIEALYGQKWVLAGILLTPIALAMPFHALMAVAGPVLEGRGNVSVELRAQTIVWIVLIVALAITSKFSVHALAWTVLGVHVLRAFILTLSVLRNVGATVAEFFWSVAGPTFYGILVAAGLLGVDLILKADGASPLMRLSTLVVAGGVAMVVIPPILKSWVIPPVLAVFLLERSTRIPSFMRAWVRAISQRSSNVPPQ